MRESKRKDTKEKIDKKDEDIQIKEKELKEIKEEMDENKNKNNEKNDKRYKIALKNIIVGCGIIIYFVILLFAKERISNIDYIKVLKAVILCDLLASLVLLEVGFRKDKFNIGLYGIEMAFVGGLTVYILDMFCKTKDTFNIWFSVIVAFIGIYYIAKSIVIAVKKKK